MKTENFTIEERLSLNRLKHGRHSVPADKNLRKTENERIESVKTGATGKEWLENLLEPEKDQNADFEQAMLKRGAKRFSEWIEKETGK